MIGEASYGDAVGDHDYGATLKVFANSFGPLNLRPRIERTGGLIHDDDGFVAEERSGGCDTMPFPAAQFFAFVDPLAQERFLFLGKFFDNGGGIGCGGGV